MSYSDQLEVRIKNAGSVVAAESIAWGTGGSFDLDGATVDLATLCQRDDVACPEDVFPAQVTMSQPGQKLHLLRVDFNKVGPLEELDEATLLGNVDSDFDFSIALGIGAAAQGACGLLGVSYATGHIDSNDDDPPVGSSLSGDIVTAYSGGCILVGQAAGAAAGLTVEFRLPFTAERIE